MVIVYDVGIERVNSIRKFLRMFLNWVQNSVFEGELTRSELERVRFGIKNLVDESEDSVRIYAFRSERVVKRIVIGQEKGFVENIV